MNFWSALCQPIGVLLIAGCATTNANEGPDDLHFPRYKADFDRVLISFTFEARPEITGNCITAKVGGERKVIIWPDHAVVKNKNDGLLVVGNDVAGQKEGYDNRLIIGKIAKFKGMRIAGKYVYLADYMLPTAIGECGKAGAIEARIWKQS